MLDVLRTTSLRVEFFGKEGYLKMEPFLDFLEILYIKNPSLQRRRESILEPFMDFGWSIFPVGWPWNSLMYATSALEITSFTIWST
jgi:hypothetical protein